MCSRTKCRICGKPTWSGCGNHVEQALQGVAKSQRCACAKNAHPANSGPANSGGGFFTRLLGGN